MATITRKEQEQLLEPLLEGLEDPQRDRALQALLGCRFLSDDDEWIHLLLAFKILIPVNQLETSLLREFRSIARQMQNELRADRHGEQDCMVSLQSRFGWRSTWNFLLLGTASGFVLGFVFAVFYLLS